MVTSTLRNNNINFPIVDRNKCFLDRGNLHKDRGCSRIALIVANKLNPSFELTPKGEPYSSYVVIDCNRKKFFGRSSLIWLFQQPTQITYTNGQRTFRIQPQYIASDVNLDLELSKILKSWPNYSTNIAER